MIPADVVSTFSQWAALGLGGGLIACLIWFFQRALSDLDSVKKTMATNMQTFMDEVHKHDLRIARLEAWRDAGRTVMRASDE